LPKHGQLSELEISSAPNLRHTGNLRQRESPQFGAKFLTLNRWRLNGQTPAWPLPSTPLVARAFGHKAVLDQANMTHIQNDHSRSAVITTAVPVSQQ